MLLLVLVISLSSFVMGARDDTSFYLVTEPSDSFVVRGGSVSLSCDVSSDTDHTVYEWRLHSGYYDDGVLLEESGGVLEYRPSDMDQHVYVSCTADVLGSRINSRYALVRISTMGTQLTELPADVTVPSGRDHVRLACGAPEGVPKPYITWQRDGAEYDEANSFVDPLGGLNIINVAAADAGVYTCTANSFADHAPITSPPAVLTVEGVEAITNIPTAYDVSFAEAR